MNLVLTPGRVLFSLRRWRREGWTTPYWKNQARPRILHTPPCRTDRQSNVEIHTLVSHDDLLNLLWTLKSFYHFSQRSYPAVIHDDGTLTAADLEILRRHFPDSRVISAAEAESTVAAALKSYPRCARYRGLHSLARKVFDIGTYFRADRLLLLDSDLIFFRTPDELLSRLDADQLPRSVFNAGQSLMLNVSADEARQRFGIELVERINSGLAVLRPQVFNFDWMEDFLGSESIWAGHVWRIEQTLLALAASRDGVELLPEHEYRVSLTEGAEGCVVKHYVGMVRHLMYREGMARLVRERFLDQLAAHNGKVLPR
jgi:hypothetical protein